eukprot:355218-Pleurochrysis_carterae.AAC.1
MLGRGLFSLTKRARCVFSPIEREAPSAVSGAYGGVYGRDVDVSRALSSEALARDSRHASCSAPVLSEPRTLKLAL